MGTNPRLSEGPSASSWPWSDLGLGETVDREAIHAAYAARRAELDSANMRISAFAELTEAREKALFFAAEKRREAARRGTVVETPSASAPEPPPAPPSPPPLPSPPLSAASEPVIAENEPEPEPEPEFGPRASPYRAPMPDPVPPPIAYTLTLPENAGRAPQTDPQSETEWEHSGGYRPEHEPFQMLKEADDDREPVDELPDLKREWEAVSERLQLKKYGTYYLIGLFVFFGYCSS
ncbi:MAG: hypothetical protein AAFY47_00695 [Pseudomonadota bacterium]